MWNKGHMGRKARAGGAALLVLSAAPALAERPISAIDWLSDPLETPVVLPPVSGTGGMADEPGIAPTAASDEIIVTSLDAPNLDAVGLLPGSVTGLPRDLWRASSSRDLIRLIHNLPNRNLPAIQGLIHTLLLAETDPPEDSTGDGRLFLARIDRLLDDGALEQAQAMLAQAGNPTPEVFRRLFDTALLTGTEDTVCKLLRSRPDLAPGYGARIFCLARGGDWQAAVLTLGTARALGIVSPAEDALLARFLDPHLFEGEPPLPPPARVTPLVFRMHAAIAEHLPTAPLPLAFAHADLGPNSGWKARIEAAERLARNGAIGESRLFGIYGEHQPAASGGVWDRVAVVQELDAALHGADKAAVATRLPPAWAAMRKAGLEVPFARHYGARLAGLGLEGTAGALAFRIGLLSPQYEEIAAAASASATGDDAFLAALARGAPPPPRNTGPGGALEQAIRRGFGETALPAQQVLLLQNGELGRVLLTIPALIRSGAAGDLGDLAGGLALLRHLGLEDIARQTALQVLLLQQET